MKPKVFVAWPLPQEAVEVLEQHCDVDVWEGPFPVPRDQLLNRLADKEGLLITGGKIDAELLNAAPKLKAISTVSVGYNNFDLDEMKARGIVGTHTPYVLDDTVADLILGLMLSAARRIPELDQLIRDGGWKKGGDEPLFGVDVHHATLGIIGMGRIGEAAARRARFGFDMNILYCNRTRRPEAEQRYDAKYCDMDELLRESDFVLLMTPLSDETRHLIGKAQFEMMKRSAIFINASRGQTVDEPALVDALKNGTIRAAGLDVFYREPITADHPLLALPNVVVTPHIGSATAKTRQEMAFVAARNLAAALTGKGKAHIVKELS